MKSVSLEKHLARICPASLAEVLNQAAASALEIEAALRLRSSAAQPGDSLPATGGQVNVQGEVQQPMDVLANEVLLRRLGSLPQVGAAISEEEAEAVGFDAHAETAEFVVLFDPLDGSSNIDVNVNVGTIVSVHRWRGAPGPSALQAGREQAAALAVNYGPATVLLLTVGDGTHLYTLQNGRFQLTTERLRMPERGPYYSLNEANLQQAPALFQRLVHRLRADGYGSRYVGSFIADLYRTLLKGGVFLYPPTHRSPQGKLRLLYEAAPLAMLVEQAGGQASTGGERILDVVPAGLHARTPLVIGSAHELGLLGELAEAGEATEG